MTTGFGLLTRYFCKTLVPPSPRYSNRFDLWPTDLTINMINRELPLLKDYLPTKFEASLAKRSWVISCTRTKVWETDWHVQNNMPLLFQRGHKYEIDNATSKINLPLHRCMWKRRKEPFVDTLHTGYHLQFCTCGEAGQQSACGSTPKWRKTRGTSPSLLPPGPETSGSGRITALTTW